MQRDYLLAAGWFAFSVLTSWIAATAGVAWTLRPLSRGIDMPWYERARLAHPARIVAILSFVPILPAQIIFGLVAAHIVNSEHEWLFANCGVAGSVIASLLVCYRLRRRLFGSRIASWLGSIIVSSVLFLGSTAVALGVLFASPQAFGARSAIVLLIGLALIVALWYGGSIWILRALRLARRASPRLTAIAEECSRQTGIPVRAVYELEWQMVNAVAMPLQGAIAFSRVALEVLDDQQLSAVCIHELAHLAEPRTVRTLRVANSMMMLGYVEALILARGYGALPILFALAGFLIGKMILARLSRSWERSADLAAVTGQAEQRVYAGALMQLHASNLQPLVMTGRGGTHPHPYDRIVAAGLQPEFPRPAPPSRLRVIAGLLIVLLAGVLTNAGVFFAAAVMTGFARAIRSNY